jgi:DNA-binding MarR family transcriptional regulator
LLKNCMNDKSRLLGLLTASQLEVLSALYRRRTPQQRLFRSRDLAPAAGGSVGRSLAHLVSKGLALRVSEGRSWRYGITDKGEATWALLQRAASVNPHAVFGGEATRARAELLRRVMR